jgi:penicillin-binding protein 1C
VVKVQPRRHDGHEANLVRQHKSQHHLERRFFAGAALVCVILGLGIPWAGLELRAALGPLDLSAATRVSQVAVDRDGRLLRAFTTADGRWLLPVTTAEVDPRFVTLLQAYEDRRFRTHHGVDLLALTRAGLQYVQRGHVVSGGSTLTMQVARLLEPREERNGGAKLRQILRAIELEKRFSKDQILALYFALAPYGGNLQGIRAASLAYFGKEPKRLTIAEAALLVALPQSPEARRPDRAPETARRARDRVLERAVAAGALTAAAAQAAKSEPVPSTRKSFPALAPHAAEEARRLAPDASVLRLTIDARLQASLEELARENAERLGPKISAAILVVDNATGAIRAHVGGADYFSSERAGAIDMTQAIRSPGSALKPFIYALAFESGIAHPETLLEDRPARFGFYAPQNFDLTFQGEVTARRALQWSLNVPAVELLNEVGPARFLARLRNAGASIALGDDAAPGLAIGLGGLGIRLVDLVRLYAGLARGGRVPDLVEWRDAPPAAPHDARITEPVAAWYVFDILRGAPPPQNAIGGRIAYKTGTSYGYRDAFAIGYDRATTIGVWVGRADNGAVPGLVGREVAAPILFDAFARLGGTREPLPEPPHVLKASSANLPPPLRHLRKDAPKTIAAAAETSLKIAYPPAGARVDLGLQQLQAAAASLALKAEGGVPPFTWIVNGMPIGAPNSRRETMWTPDGAGFARVSVIDARGASDSVMVRLE